MARISFRTKPRVVYNHDETISHSWVSVPKLTRTHCDMAAFRQHKKFGGLANSDLFENVLTRVRRDVFPREGFKLGQEPAGVTVKNEGYMVLVSFDV